MSHTNIGSTRALVTLEEARSFCFRDENDATRDVVLIDAVNQVSAAIWRHCEREFLTTDGATRSFALTTRFVGYSSVGWIDLTPYDLRTLTTLTLYTDQAVADQQVLTTDEYRLRPVGGDRFTGTYLNVLTILPTKGVAQPGFGWEISIEGDWGMSSVPNDVKLAALQWIDNIVKNPAAWSSEQAGGFSYAPEIDIGAGRAGMPAAVRHRLAPYKRNI